MLTDSNRFSGECMYFIPPYAFSSASAEARVKHSAERWRLDTNPTEGRMRARKTECDWLKLAWISGLQKKEEIRNPAQTRKARTSATLEALHAETTSFPDASA